MCLLIWGLKGNVSGGYLPDAGPAIKGDVAICIPLHTISSYIWKQAVYFARGLLAKG